MEGGRERERGDRQSETGGMNVEHDLSEADPFLPAPPGTFYYGP